MFTARCAAPDALVIQTYSVLGHGQMLADRRRLDAYLSAIRRAVRPGSVVVDVGSGSGIFSLAACRAGARRVYAIEPGGIAEIARELAYRNGCADRITFIDAVATDATVPEPADVIVMDVRGVLPDDQIRIARHARTAWLRPGGVMIPARDELWIALANAPELHRQVVAPWLQAPMAAGLVDGPRLASLTWRKAELEAHQRQSDARRAAVIDYAEVEADAIEARIDWTMRSEGAAHGAAIWFESLVGEGIRISNAPGAPRLIYGQAFFPWPEAVYLSRGDRVIVDLCGTVSNGRFGWRWITRIGPTPAGAVRTFDQWTEAPRPWAAASVS